MHCGHNLATSISFFLIVVLLVYIDMPLVYHPKRHSRPQYIFYITLT